MSSDRPTIRVEGLGKRYSLRRRQAPATLVESIARRIRQPFARSERNDFWALKDVTFEVRQGEVVGLIGRNGSGKSTLLKILSRITEMTEGEAELTGRVGSLLEVGTGFHQDLTGRENIFMNGAMLGMTPSEIRQQFDAIVAFAGVEPFLDTAVKHYSSGMYVRLAFAVAAHLRSEILIVDEVLAVGDVAFQRKCLGKMGSVARAGRTVLFVSHNMQAVRQLCQRAVWLRDGRVLADGPSGQVVDAYLRDAPDTQGVEELSKSIDALPEDPVFRLRGVSIMQDGQSTLDILNGQPLEVRVDYDVLASTPGLHICLELCDNEGGLIFQSIHNGDSSELPVVEKGRHSTRALVPADFLAPTTYELRVTVGIAGIRAIIPSLGVRIQVQASGRVNRAYPGYPTPGKIAPLIPWVTESQELPS